jgi:hypothetical protein
LAQAKPRQTLQRLGINRDTGKNKILRRARQLKMKALLERYKKEKAEDLFQEIAKRLIKRELSADELERSYSIAELKAALKVGDADVSLNKKVEKDSSGNPTSLINADIDEKDVEEAILLATSIKSDKDSEDKEDTKALKESLSQANKVISELKSKVEKYEKEKAEEEKAKRDALIKSRREELGDFAKDMKDEDILDDIKFENAKLKKAIADLKAGKKVDIDLSKGSVDKDVDSPEKIARKKVDEYAWGNENDKK